MENQRFGHRRSGIGAGILLLAVGSVLLLQRFGTPMPAWLFSWPMLLITIGLFVGIKHGFRGPGWAIMILIGSIFLVDIIQPELSIRRYTAPIIIIAAGLFMIFRPRSFRNHHYHAARRYQIRARWQGMEQQPGFGPKQAGFGPVDDEPDPAIKTDLKQDYIDTVAVFGGIRKVVVSKNFKGGDVVAIIGGTEIDLSQADIDGRVVLDVVQILGGTKLIVPAHWNIQSEMVAFFGGIEDKRQIPAGAMDSQKILVLKGTSIFGGIDIRNY